MKESKYPPLPGKFRYKDWEDNTNPKLKEYGKTIVSDKWYNLLKTALLLILISVGVIGYMIYDGKLQPEFSCPEIIIPECPSCPAEVPCPACPTQTCTNSCDFPESLEVNLNETG